MVWCSDTQEAAGIENRTILYVLVHLWRQPINHSFKPFNVNKSLSKSSIQGRWPFKKKMTSQIKLNILFDLQPSHFLNPYCFVIVAVFELSSCHVAQAGL